ncbi:hypothetical protein PENTCL1PPCAC_24181, partial [Pristionchus entomophagus]
RTISQGMDRNYALQERVAQLTLKLAPYEGVQDQLIRENEVLRRQTADLQSHNMDLLLLPPPPPPPPLLFSLIPVQQE